MHPLAHPSGEIYRLHRRLLLNCLDGMDDATATRPLAPATNHAAFLALHLIEVRHWLLGNLLGRETTNPFAELSGGAQGIDDIPRFPTVKELNAAWEEVSDHLEGALEELGEEQLEAPVEPSFPVADGSLAGALAFLAQHEAYHVGQLALLRKGLGLGAMSYE